MEDREFLLFLNSWFADASLTGGGLPFQFMAHTRLSYSPFYVYYAQNDIDEVVSNRLIAALRSLGEQDANRQTPLLVIKTDGITYKAWIFAYWEYNHCRLNKKVYERPLNAETISWFEMQLSAHRMHINSIPMEYVGVIKTISLNTHDLVEADIIYWRKLTDTYKMTPNQPQDEQARFNRLLHGTPENEYPCDVLDSVIFQQVQSVYPEAKVRSKLLLFDNDLLNFRNLKDKIHKNPVCKVMLYNTVAFRPIDILDINLDCYYYPNFYKQGGIKLLGQASVDNIQNFNEIKDLYTTSYKPISSFII